MKNIAVCLLISILPFYGICQQYSDTTKHSKEINFPVVSQIEPSFPGGDQALLDYIIRNINYTDTAKLKKIQGLVMVSFDVMPDSTLADITVLKGLGYGINEEVVRLLNPLKFIPGMTNGVLVRKSVIISVPLIAH